MRSVQIASDAFHVKHEPKKNVLYETKGCVSTGNRG